jgi:hypothetical protein
MIAVLALSLPKPGQAHCDSRKGPVASAAHQALETGDVKLILPYVKPDDEAELTAAFKQALDVSKQGGKARDLATSYFLEIAVRLHRQGEGAAYTGLTNEPVPAAIQAADKAMETGSLEGVYHLLDEAMQQGVKDQYQAMLKARKEAEAKGTVPAHRERVEAELIFEKYVYGLYETATAESVHAEGQAQAPAHSH